MLKVKRGEGVLESAWHKKTKMVATGMFKQVESVWGGERRVKGSDVESLIGGLGAGYHYGWVQQRWILKFETQLF